MWRSRDWGTGRPDHGLDIVHLDIVRIELVNVQVCLAKEGGTQELALKSKKVLFDAVTSDPTTTYIPTQTSSPAH